MAMVILGTAKCPVCQKVIEAANDVVAFSWFETSYPALNAFSDAGVHYGCLQNNPDRSELESIYLAQLGEDGVRPNGRQTHSLSASLRLSFDARIAVISSGPLFLTLDMPLPTAIAWLDSAFWEQAEHGSFSGKGLDAQFDIVKGDCHLSFRLCPHGVTPRNANANLVKAVDRQVSKAAGQKSLKDLKAALHFIAGATAIRTGDPS